GPLFVALELGVPLGLMIGMGCAIGFGAALAGVFFASWSNRPHVLGIPPEDVAASEQTPRQRLPSLWLSLLPILLPIVLIGLEASFTPPTSGWLAWSLKTFGDKDMALTIGAMIALGILARERHGTAATKAVGAALASGATILLIIAAGGAFGGALRQTGISTALGSALTGLHLLA